MPQYTWSCQKCKKRIDIVTDMSQSDVPPEEKSAEGCRKHKWTRDYMGQTFQKTYGANWGYHRKGHWNNQ